LHSAHSTYNLGIVTRDIHPDFRFFEDSWMLALASDSYSPSTQTSYRASLESLATFLAVEAPDVGPMEVSRDDIRRWLIFERELRSSATARSRFAGVRHFFRWMVEEQERSDDPTQGIRSPPPGDPLTPVLSVEDLRKLVGVCKGRTFKDRRDYAIVLTFVDGGLRLAEVTGLKVASVDLRERELYVIGKGSRRSGPRRRIVPVGLSASRALDAYLRVRRRHPLAEREELWLGARNRGPLSDWAVKRVVTRRAEQAGLGPIHPHALRHSWASHFRQIGGEEGDLMTMGGWKSRQMLDRYGRAASHERAREAYRSRSLGDRL
jgi:site-specific recombinase XerD